MINWTMVIPIALAATAGAELGRRSAERKGKFFSHLSLSEQRIYNILSTFSGALCIEVSRLALNQPSETHVWYLIGTFALAFITLIRHMAREQKVTQHKLEQLQASSQ